MKDSLTLPATDGAELVAAKGGRESDRQASPERNLGGLGDIADGVAHDFTNVFAVILAYANFIKEASPFDDPRRQDAHQILLAAGVGTALVRQLLAVAGHTTERKPIDLNDSLVQAEGLLSRSLAGHCELSVATDPSPVVVRIDPVQFDQIVMGLALNACAAVPRGGKVRITLERVLGAAPANGDIARMTVADTSAGLSADARQRLFEPAQGGDSRRAETLRLADCLRRVEDAGGVIGVLSSEGQGVSFIVDFPICDQSSKQAEPELQRAGHGERVLIVENDPGLRHAAGRALERAGYDVSLAATSEQARDRIVELGEQLEVLVADAAMGAIDVSGLSALARSGSPRVVLIFTRLFNEDATASPRSDPDVRTLFKPVLPAELVSAVSRALAEQASPPPTPEANEREVVLVVEDDESVRAALERVLDYAGYSTLVASTLAAARELLESGPGPDFMLCDLSLPDGSSVELLELVRKRRPALAERVLILSGGAIEDADVAFARSGVFRVLTKPVDVAALLRILDRSGRP